MIDFNLKPGQPTINDDVDYIRQQIDILFDTSPGDLFGDIEYGTDYEKLLYELKLSADQLSSKMSQDLGKLDLMGFNYYVSSRLMQGTQRDIALIEVDLRKGGTEDSKIYRIE